MKQIFRRLREDRGFSVIELTVASALLVVVVGAALSMLDSATKSERNSQARDTAEVSLRSAMTQLTKELRTATSIDPHSTQSVLDMQALISDGTGAVTQHRVVYQIVGTGATATLQRIQDATGTAPGPYGGNPVQLADKIVAPEAFYFCYQFDDTSGTCTALSPPAALSAIRVSLSITPVAFSAGAVTLATDVQLRNMAD